MITVADNCTFCLQGKDYTYAMYVNDSGFLQHAYYGKKIGVSDLEYLIGHICSKFAPTKGGLNYDMQFDNMPSECGFYAHGDYREPTVIIERSDGAAMSRLRYVSHKVYGGAPTLAGLPHARKGGDTLAVTLKDDFSDATVILNYTVYDDLNVLVRNAEIVNVGKEEFTLKKAFSFCVDLPDSEFDIMRLCGRWAAERTPVTSPIKYGITRLQSLRGSSSHKINPFAAFLRANCAEESGECYGVQLVYSGSFALSAESSADGSLRVQGGVNDTAFGWTLRAGESFTSPQAALCYSDGGTGKMSRHYADFLRECVIDPRYVYKKRPIVVNNWEATYFDFDNEKLFPIIDEAAKLGIDTFVLDDGWFGKRDSDTSGLGDWTVNEKKLKGGLKTVIDRCKKQGLKFGLWFEPEMISEDSDLYRAHPDWAIGKDGVQPCRGRNQLVLDLTRSDVVDHVFAAVSNVLANNDISYVKWDFNRDLTEMFSRKLDRQGEFAHRYMLGVYSLAERLTKAFPDVFFEGCAGGGGRFDAGMLYYFPQIWTSDDTDAYERAKIQWGTSMCYPVSAMSCHVSACPNHQTGRTVSIDTRGAIASLGATGYELDLSKMTDDEKSAVKAQIGRYGAIAELVLKGDLYRLCDPFNGNWFCVMLVAKDKDQAYVVGERIHAVPCDLIKTVKLAGLDADKTYGLDGTDIVASGRAMMTAGIVLPGLGDYGSFTWKLKQIESEK